VAASLGTLAGGDPERYLALMVMLTLMTGTLYVIAGIARLGFIANFLSQPVLVGFLNGIALLIIAGQLPKLFGYSSGGGDFLAKLLEFASSMAQFHLPTVMLGLGLLVLLVLLRHVAPKLPAALVVVVVGIVAVIALGLEERGIQVLGEVPSGLPTFYFAVFDRETYAHLLEDAAALMLISFTSGVLTAKSFARRNRYEIDANQEMIAFGAANIVKRRFLQATGARDHGRRRDPRRVDRDRCESDQRAGRDRRTEARRASRGAGGARRRARLRACETQSQPFLRHELGNRAPCQPESARLPHRRSGSQGLSKQKQAGDIRNIRRAGMSFFERYLAVWIALCSGPGIVLG